jgi:hypothetical protein
MRVDDHSCFYHSSCKVLLLLLPLLQVQLCCSQPPVCDAVG